MGNLYGNKNGKKIFNIPVEWVVAERLMIKADTLKEAVQFVIDNLDEIPLGTEPDYIDGTYKISADENDNNNVEEILYNIENIYGYDEFDEDEFNEEYFREI